MFEINLQIILSKPKLNRRDMIPRNSCFTQWRKEESYIAVHVELYGGSYMYMFVLILYL